MARKAKASPTEDASGTFEERLAAKFELKLASQPLTSDIEEYISTQCAMLDYAIGRPGIPVGRVTVFYGKEGAGKSSVAYHVLAETQRRGGLAILIDAEHRYSRDRGERLGLIPARLVMPTPTTLEDCFVVIEEIIKWVREEDPARLVCIVIDSLSALDAKKNLELAVGEQAQLGLAARTISREMQRLGPMLAEHKVALIIVNQLRQHLDIMGDPRSRERRKAMKRHTMTGEGALVFWGSLLVYFTSTGVIKDDDAQTGITVRAEIRKSSIAPEGKQSLFDIDAIDGVDKEGSQLDLLETLKIVTKAGPWYSLDGIKFQRRQFPTVLAERPELLQKIQEAPLLWRPDPNEKAEETADA
jgi:recombination protein RecA